MTKDLALDPSGHVDTFVRERLPSMAQWPEPMLGGFAYPDWLNAAVELTDRMVERGFGDHAALPKTLTGRIRRLRLKP